MPGSTQVGQRIAQLTAASLKKVSLELGGKNAAVVFNDANIEDAVKGVIRSSFLNQGEICLCTSRVRRYQTVRQSTSDLVVSDLCSERHCPDFPREVRSQDQSAACGRSSGRADLLRGRQQQGPLREGDGLHQTGQQGRGHHPLWGDSQYIQTLQAGLKYRGKESWENFL